MTDVTFAFPTSAADRERLIAKHKRKGRQWVSTALVDGRMRMKFERVKRRPLAVEEAPRKPHKRVAERKMERRLSRYAGYANNGGRGEWER